MKTICLHDKDRIEAFLRRNTFLNIYQLGDLDDYFWPRTTWYALTNGDDIKAIALVFGGLNQPTLLAMGDNAELLLLQELLRSALHLLPRSFYSHMNLGLAEALANDFRVDSHGEHCKMALTDTTRLDAVDTAAVIPLFPPDAAELLKFYEESYPSHWFEPPMLDTKQYFGIRGADGLISVAGVHVYSEEYQVAALGNITTHRAHRRSGYAKATTAGLCKNLLRTVQHIGLNVKADNQAAIACYQELGFEIVGAYEECRIGTAAGGLLA